MPRGHDTSGDPRRQPLKPGDAGYTLPSIAGLLQNMASRQQPKITRNRWGDEVNPGKPKSKLVEYDPGESPTDPDDPRLREGPTFLEGKPGYINDTDYRVNRFNR